MSIGLSGTTIDTVKLREHERSLGPGGFIYVVEFSDGTVKPGFTETPLSRLRTHALDGKKFGHTIRGWWVSPRHPDAKLWEKHLLASANDMGIARTKEYFSGVDFHEIVVEAQRVHYEDLGLQGQFVNVIAEVPRYTTVHVQHHGSITSLILDRSHLQPNYAAPEHVAKVLAFNALGDAAASLCVYRGLREEVTWGCGNTLACIVCPSVEWQEVYDLMVRIELGEPSAALSYATSALEWVQEHPKWVSKGARLPRMLSELRSLVDDDIHNLGQT